MRRRSAINIIIGNIIVASGLAASMTYAQGIAIQGPADVAGNWVLESTAIYLTGKRAPEGSKWVFGADGNLARTSLYKFSESLTESGREGTIEEKFEVKDGKIVTANGDTFALIERKPDTMTLKGPFGYYFLKKE
ncbi:MAG: hypothetical protein M3461_13330 [Pseudomonadota bacterium]|nr:hypothetical protein [Pseudomonadota bacterium]